MYFPGRGLNTSWQRTARVPLVEGRLAGTLLVLVGLGCAVPAAFWPTHTLTFPRGPDAGVVVPQVVGLWSWGRIAEVGPETSDLGLDFGNPAGLTLFVIALVAGAAACACHGLRPGPDGVLLGVVGTVWPLAHLGADLGQTAGRLGTGFYGDSDVLRATTVAGALQFVGVALLLAALTVMVWRPALRLAVAGWAKGAEAARRHRGRTQTDDAEGSRSAPRVGIATIRDVDPGRGPVGPGRWGRRGDGADAVGFSDEPGTDPGKGRPPS